jgi:hypothetical protein
MYRITICNKGGKEIGSLCSIIPLTPGSECGILQEYPEGSYLDIARIPINTRSDSFAFGNIDLSQEDYE